MASTKAQTQATRLPAVDYDGLAILGLYTLFHRDRGNRLIHALLVPVVMFCGMVAFAHVRWPGASSDWAHLGTPSVVLLIACWATIDVIGALAAGTWLLAMAKLAGWVVAHYPTPIVAAVDFVVHAVAWYFLVITAHVDLEQPLQVAGKWVDSNVFFRRGWFVMRNVHSDDRPRPSLRSAFIQATLAPYAATVDVMWSFGLREQLRRDIHALHQTLLGRLAAGRAPL